MRASLRTRCQRTRGRRAAPIAHLRDVQATNYGDGSSTSGARARATSTICDRSRLRVVADRDAVATHLHVQSLEVDVEQARRLTLVAVGRLQRPQDRLALRRLTAASAISRRLDGDPLSSAGGSARLGLSRLRISGPVMVNSSVSSTAWRTALRSSRTLPGQLWAMISAAASSSNPATARRSCDVGLVEESPRQHQVSRPRSRSGGTVIVNSASR